MSGGNGATILVVDDEKVVLNLLRRVLERAGYRVLAATDGNQAVEIGRRHPEPIDLLITDIRMPGLTGKEAADLLCHLRPNLKVLFISGYSEYNLEDLNPCSNVEGNFLAKPFVPADVLDKVKRILGSS